LIDGLLEEAAFLGGEGLCVELFPSEPLEVAHRAREILENSAYPVCFVPVAPSRFLLASEARDTGEELRVRLDVALRVLAQDTHRVRLLAVKDGVVPELRPRGELSLQLLALIRGAAHHFGKVTLRRHVVELPERVEPQAVRIGFELFGMEAVDRAAGREQIRRVLDSSSSGRSSRVASSLPSAAMASSPRGIWRFTFLPWNEIES
jgi:hypothetical protein